jgi:hypothetical protein
MAFINRAVIVGPKSHFSLSARNPLVEIAFNLLCRNIIRYTKINFEIAYRSQD